MTMKRTSFRRHNFKKSLKSAANLIFAIKGFAEFFESIQSFCGCRSAPVSAGFGFGFGEAIGDDDLPIGPATGGAGFGGGERGL